MPAKPRTHSRQKELPTWMRQAMSDISRHKGQELRADCVHLGSEWKNLVEPIRVSISDIRLDVTANGDSRDVFWNVTVHPEDMVKLWRKYSLLPRRNLDAYIFAASYTLKPGTNIIAIADFKFKAEELERSHSEQK